MAPTSELFDSFHFIQMSSDMFGYINFDGKILPLNPAWEKHSVLPVSNSRHEIGWNLSIPMTDNQLR